MDIIERIFGFFYIKYQKYVHMRIQRMQKKYLRCSRTSHYMNKYKRRIMLPSMAWYFTTVCCCHYFTVILMNKHQILLWMRPLHIASFNFKLNTCNIIYTKLNLLFNSLYKHALQLVILVVDSLLSLNERHAHCSDLNGNLFDDIFK